MQYRAKTPLVLTLIGMHLVASNVAAGPRNSQTDDTAPILRNVELTEDGTAKGLVVDANGQPAAKSVVELHIKDRIYQTTTGQDGTFAVPGLAGGTCVVKVGDVSYGCRLWVHGTAPPNSLVGLVVVNGDPQVVRAQGGSLFDDGWGLLNPLHGLTKRQLIALGLLAGGVTTAIVIAAQDDGDSSN